MTCNKPSEEELSVHRESGLWVTRKMAGGRETLVSACICSCKGLFCVCWRLMGVSFPCPWRKESTEIITADIHAPASHFSVK